MQRAGGKTKPLTDVTELIGKDVYVKPGKYYDRLVNLDKELGGGIHIHKVTNDSISVEDSSHKYPRERFLIRWPIMT